MVPTTAALAALFSSSMSAGEGFPIRIILPIFFFRSVVYLFSLSNRLKVACFNSLEQLLTNLIRLASPIYVVSRLKSRKESLVYRNMYAIIVFFHRLRITILTGLILIILIFNTIHQVSFTKLWKWTDSSFICVTFQQELTEPRCHKSKHGPRTRSSSSTYHGRPMKQGRI